MAGPDDHARTSLPLWITAGCLVAGACLFFGNTVPALRERDDLGRVADELDTLKHRCAQAIEAKRLAGAGGGEVAIDLQSLFVAIDAKGYTISEFCAAWPVEDAADDEVGRR